MIVLYQEMHSTTVKTRKFQVLWTSVFFRSIENSNDNALANATQRLIG